MTGATVGDVAQCRCGHAYDPIGCRITTTSAGGVRRVQTYGLDPNAVAVDKDEDY